MNKPLPTTLPMQKNRKHIFSIGLIALLVIGYFVADAILFTGIKPKPIHEAGFIANYYAKENTKSKTAVILIGGGPWGDYWGQEFAKSNYVGLSLPYYREEGLPQLMEEIPLEYFKKAVLWLKKQPEVNPDKIIVMGASRNAELALLIASFFPNNIHGAIAFNPSSVS
jgi:pimeloyl-ACP methyl ester carboxylesterase